MLIKKKPAYKFWDYRDTRKEKFLPLKPPELPEVPGEVKIVKGLISHHILLPRKDLPQILIDRFKIDLTLRNPDFEAAAKYGKGFVSYAIPEFVHLYSMDTEYMGLPRSVRLAYVHKQFAKCGLKLELEDIRPKFDIIPWKEKNIIKPIFYQEDAISRMVKDNIILKFGCGKGKCVTGETLVSYGNGVIDRLENVINRKPKTIQTIDGRRKVGYYFHGGWKASIEIITKTGFKLCGTASHPVFIFDGYYFFWKRLGDIKIGDTIVCKPLFLQDSCTIGNSYRHKWGINEPSTIEPSLPKYIEPYISRLAGYIIGDGCMTAKNVVLFSNNDKEIIDDYSNIIKRFGLNINKRGKYGYAVCSVILKEFLNYLGVKNVLAGQKSIPPFVMKSKEMAAEFIRGYFECDGWVDKSMIGCTSKSKKIIYDIKNILLSFGIFSSVVKKTLKSGRYKGNVYFTIVIRPQHFKNFRKKIGFVSTKKNGKLLECIRNLPNTRYNKHITYNVSSLIKNLLYSLPLGRRNGWSNYTSSENRMGREMLCFFTKKFKNRMAGNKMFETLKYIVDNDLYFDTVCQKNNYHRKVYDINVPSNHNFIANSIVSHNTTMALLATTKIRLSTLIIVRTNILMGQWINAVKSMYEVEENEIGIINGGTRRFGPITIAMEQSLSNMTRDEKYKIGGMFGHVIVDEGHEACSHKFSELMGVFKCRRIHALTATPERDDGLTPIIKAYIGPITEIDDLGEFKTKIRLKKTKFHYNFVGKKDKYHELLNALIHDTDRNQLIVDDVKEFIGAGKIAVCYSNRIEHMEILEQMVKKQMPQARTDILASRKYGVSLKIQDQNAIRNNLNSLQINNLFGGKIVEQGFDCPPLEVAILATPSKSRRLILQVLGRCQREWPGKKQALLCDYIDEKTRILLVQYFTKNRRIYRNYPKEYADSLQLELEV